MVEESRASKGQSDNALQKKRNRRRTKQYSVSKWLILLFAISVATVLAAYLNISNEDNSVSRLEHAINTNDDDQKINWDNYPTIDVRLSETLNITSPGTYHLTGSLEEGGIVIDAPNSPVRLILDDVTIKNSIGPAVLCRSAERLVIETVGDNTLEDGQEYVADYPEGVNAAIFSESDLVFQGDGILRLTANYLDGISSDDNLKFISGTYYIAAEDDAIRGKDSVHVLGGNYIIDSVADAIKSTNNLEAGRGFILIDGGNFNVKSGAKGLKAVETILIHGGEISLDTYDDAIHSDNYIGISDGNISIRSGDDGIHAKSKIIIDGGSISIINALEGLEAIAVSINGGTLELNTSNDGINAGGEDNPKNSTNSSSGSLSKENCILEINGGDIYVNSSGDGLDSNGWIYINGGMTRIDGPSSSRNGAIDATVGTIMNGGEVIAIGSSEMAGGLGSTSSIYNISLYLFVEKTTINSPCFHTY